MKSLCYTPANHYQVVSVTLNFQFSTNSEWQYMYYWAVPMAITPDNFQACVRSALPPFSDNALKLGP